WGIGEDTFEYWSWLARQYRVLAELMEIALRAGLKLPVTRKVDGKAQPSSESIGANPTNHLQHPGYYYFQAARCTQERLDRFRRIADAEVRCTLNLHMSSGYANSLDRKCNQPLFRSLQLSITNKKSIIGL